MGQHGAVEASDALLAIERYSGVRPVELQTIRRQDPARGQTVDERDRIKQYRRAVKLAADGKLAESFTQLDNLGGVVTCGVGEQAEKLADEYVQLAGTNVSAVVVSQTWDEVRRVNEQVRAKLKAKGLLGANDVTVQTLEKLDLTNAQKRDERFYPPDAVIAFNQKVRNAEPGAKGTLGGIVKTGVLVEVNGRFVTVSNKLLGKITVCRPQATHVAENDRLHLKANARLKLGGRASNGELVTVKSISADGKIKLAERLCYTGARGMGALEFAPATGPKPQPAKHIEIDALVKLASEVLSQRKNLKTTFAGERRKNALNDILRVGTSAGGARAKAVIAWNRDTNEVRSGQIAAGAGFDYWLLKFDGVTGNKDKELEDPKGYGAIEYAYYLMAKAAGINMSECRLLEENGRRHFMTRRFDRLAGGEKLHMQSLGALAHFDFNQAGAYAYEQALLVIRQLNLPMADVEEQFRRMAFNLIARNQDDHVKNIAFLMDKAGRWSLAPAFDVTYSFSLLL